VTRFGADPSVVEAWKSRMSQLSRLNACQMACRALWKEVSERAGNENDPRYKHWLTGLSQHLMTTHHGLVFTQEAMAQGTFTVESMRSQPRHLISRPPAHVLAIAQRDSEGLVKRVNNLTVCICSVTGQPCGYPPSYDPLTRARGRRR
jgi:hypothetical protein